MPINNKIKSLYDAMRADGADVGTAEEFNDWFLRPGSEGYNNRKSVYDAFKADGADVGKNYEEFRDWLGMRPKSSVQKQTQQPKTEEPTLPNLSQLAGKEPMKTTPYIPQDEVSALYPMNNLNLEQRLKPEIDKFVEDKAINKIYIPKEVKSASDVARNYADRFKLTKHGEQLSNELADTEKKVTDKYATQFQQVPEFQDLLKKYKGDELNERVGELFQQMYGKNIEEEMKPYSDAYYKAMSDRYGNDIEREQAQFLKQEVGAQVERQGKDIEERLKDAKKGNATRLFQAQYGHVDDEANKRTGLLQAAHSLNRESSNMINEAAKTGHTTIVGAVGRGIRDTAFNPETWSFGLADLMNNKFLKETLDKADKGEKLSDDEQTLLDAAVTNMATQAYYSSDLSLAYKAGQTTGASLPFMLEFAVNPVAASGSSIAKSILRYGIKKFGKAAMKNSMAKMGARLVGDAAAAAMMTGTTGLGNVAAGTLDREIGRVTFDTADDGKVVYNGREGQQDFGTAVAKSFATQFLENQSEMVFNAFKGTGGVLLDRLEKAAPGLANRIKNMSAPQFYKDIMSNPTLVEVAKRTQFHGLPEEYLEEVYNNFANVPLGEMTMEEATDLDQNIETFVSLIPTTVGFAALGLGGLGAQRFKSYRHRKQMEKHLTPEDLQRIDGLQNDNDVVEYIKEVTRNGILNADTKKWMIQAASERAATIAQEQLRQEQTPEQNAADDAYAGGAEQDHAGNYQTERNRASLSEELETKAPGLAANIEEMVENEASAGEMRSLFGSLEGDVVKTAEAYYHALLSEKGAMDNAQAGVDEAVSRFEKGLASVTDTEGNVTTATYKDKAVYVISQEGDNATIQHADGSREVVFAKHLQGTQTTPAQTLADNKRKQLAGQSRQDMGNRFSNHPNTQEPKEGMQLWNGDAPYIVTGIRQNADGTQTITAFPAVFDNKSGQMVAKQGSTPIEMSHDEAMQLQNDYYNRMDENNGNTETETVTAPTEEQTEEPQTTASENASTENSAEAPTTEDLIRMAREGNELAQYQLSEQGISWEQDGNEAEEQPASSGRTESDLYGGEEETAGESVDAGRPVQEEQEQIGDSGTFGKPTIADVISTFYAKGRESAPASNKQEQSANKESEQENPTSEKQAEEENSQSERRTESAPVRQTMSEKKRKATEKVAKALGVKVEWVDTMEANGEYDPQTRTIKIARDAENPLVEVFGHEATHSVKHLSNEAYQALRDAMKSLMGEKAWNKAIAETKAMYAAKKKEISDAAAEEEVVCDAVGRVIFEKDGVERLAKYLSRNGLTRVMESIYDTLKKMWNALRGVEPEVADKLENAMRVIEKEFDKAARVAAMAKENNISVETARELSSNGLTMEQDVVMSPAAAGHMRESGYTAPTQDKKYSWRTMLITIDTLKKNGEAIDEHVARDLERMYERVAMNDFVGETIRSRISTSDARTKGKRTLDSSPLRKQGDIFIRSFDMDTSCPRTMAYLTIVKEVEKRINRVLGLVESQQLIEKMRAYGIEIPCTYCYVENKRQALKEAYGTFINARRAVLGAKTEQDERAGMYGHVKAGDTQSLTKAAENKLAEWKALKSGKGMYNPTAEMLYRHHRSARNTILSYLDAAEKAGLVNNDMSVSAIVAKVKAQFSLNEVGDRGIDTKADMTRISGILADICDEWKFDSKESRKHEEFEEANYNAGLQEFEVKSLSLWREMDLYAKSSSGAKNVSRYVPYTDEILSLTPSDIIALNAIGGLRSHSNNDFRIDYVFDYFQLFSHMARRRLMGQTYSKNPDYVKIFGKTGQRINMSIAAYGGENGTPVLMNQDEGFNWEVARELRKAYPDAGTMFMVTNDAQLQMALDADWVDMIIPFHASGLPKALWMDMRAWQDYTSLQNDNPLNTDEMSRELESDEVSTNGMKSDEVRELYESHFNIKKMYDENGKRIYPHFEPGETRLQTSEGVVTIPGHKNDKETYLNLCREYGLRPRFSGKQVMVNGKTADITEHPNYMRLIKETARTDSEQTPVRYNFDEEDEFLPVISEETSQIIFGKKNEERIGKHMTPSEYAIWSLYDFASRGGYDNITDYKKLTEDSGYGDIAGDFINDVIRSKEERPMNYLSEQDREMFRVTHKALYESAGLDPDTAPIPYHPDGNVKWSVRRGNKKGTIQDRAVTESVTGQPAISNDAIAKIQNALDATKKFYEKRSNRTRGFITDISNDLGLSFDGASHYGTFMDVNGKDVELRISNHNASTETFDKRDESEGVSIVISRYRNKGIANSDNSKVHLIEFFYPKWKIEKSKGKPLVALIDSLKEFVNTGVFEDKSGLGSRQEINSQKATASEQPIREERVGQTKSISDGREIKSTRTNPTQSYNDKSARRAAETALRDAVNEHLRRAGIEVIENEAEGQRVLDMANDENVETSDQRAEIDGQPVSFFRTPNGEAYGFTIGGKIYIDPRIATTETPIHEYTHLWATALRNGNPKEWKNVVKLMKGTSVWNEVKKNYPELKTDDEIADEVLAHYSGRRGAERLREEQRKLSEGSDLLAAAEAVTALERVRKALDKFWKAVADFLHIHYTSAEEVADRVMSDLLNGVNPTTATTEALDADGGTGIRYSLRKKPAPKKTEKCYKLMRLGEDGKLYPLFIDSAAPTELGKWYDADSPNLSNLKKLPSGVHLIDNATGDVTSYEEFFNGHKDLFVNGKTGKKPKMGKYPSKEAIGWATDNGARFVYIEDTERAQKRFEGESRKYWNLGINGSGAVSTFSMRPGWHAGTLPTMRQIGKGADKDLRDDRFVWVEGEVSADIDYNEEASRNPDNDIPDRIPEDGFYMKSTNGDAKKAQADRVGWYVAGSFKANRIISDREARSVIDDWNAAHPDKKVEYDYERESGKDFDADTMSLVDKGILFRDTENAGRSISERIEKYDKENGTELGRFVRFVETGTIDKGASRHFKVAVAGAKLQKYGIVGNIMASTSTVSSHHTEDADHNLSPENWLEALEGINEPLAITKNRGDKKKYRVYTTATINGKTICLALQVRTAGFNVELTNIKTAFGKDIVKALESEDVIYPSEEKRKKIIESYSSNANSRRYTQLPSLSASIDNNSETANRNDENSSELDEKSAAIAEEVERMGNELAPVRVVRSEADLTDEERAMLQNRRREAVLRGTESNVKGWFDPKTGEVVVYLPNAESVDDARRTFLHEVVGHKGLRELIGRDKFDAAMEELYGLLPESERKKVDAKGGSRAAAMDEYLAEQAEKDEKPTWWDRVTSVIRKMLRKAGLNVELTDGEVRYLLWRSRENIQRNNALAVAEDIHMRETSGIGDIRFRDVASPNSPSPADTAEAWDKLANSTAFLMRETTVDYLTAVEKFQDLIAKKTHSRVLDSENAYYAFLALTSKSRQEMDAFEAAFMGPLSEALSRFVDRSDRKPARLRLWGETSIPRPFAKEVDWDKGQARELVMYVTAKHGMERNLDMAVQKYLASIEDKAQREQMRQDWENERDRIKTQNISWEDKQDQLRDYAEQQMGVDTSEDYSGLSEMFGDPILYPNGWQAEARSYMEAYEQNHDADDIDALWNAIGNATQFALEKQLQSGLVSQEYVDRQRKRFDYYIPLRGFADETAGDVYQYIQNEYYPGGNPVKTAKGRTSEAGNPFGSILQIAYSSISSGNKNLAKQALYRFVNNHDTGGLINVNKAVAIKFNEASAKYPNLFKQPEQGAQPSEWVEAVPIIPADATREEIAQIMDEFDKAIADLKKAGEAEDIGRKSKIAYRTLGKERNEHQITVFLGGNKHVITITGNPRLAQAANGLLNPDTSDDSLSQMAKRVQRGMAGMFTSKNVAFSLANLFRDTEYANNQAFVNESPAYWARFSYHQGLGLGKLPQLTKLLLQYRRGTLDLSDKSARQFKEFLDNGGATGYTFVENQNEYALQIAEDMNQLIKRKNLGKKGWDAVWNAIEFAGNVAELVNRFAAYQTSREVGRSVARSIIDAKEISTNFNRKGAGRKTADTTKDRGILDPVHITAALSQYGRTMIIFWNAGIQSKYRFYKNLKEHPIKTATTQIGGCMALSAVLVPLWNNMVAPVLFSVFGMGGDDDDSDYYDTLTDYERGNYICLRAPKGYWIKIPLTPELKPWYSMGDCIGAAAAGKRDIEARDVWENVGDAISPASVNWNYKGGQFAINAMPTVAQPLFQHGMNVNFMGSTIRKEKAFGSGQYDPEYTKVSRRTSPVLVGASKAWNQFLMGSDGDIKTAGTFDFNPAVLQNYITGYTGGFGQTFILAADMIKAWANGESTPLTMSRSPLSGRFVISGNKEVQLDRIDMGYYDVRDFINQIDHDEKALKKKVKDSAKDPVEYAGYKRRLEELMRSDDYRKAKTLEYYDDGIKKYQKYLESDPDNVTAREAMYAAKRQAIEMLKQR